MSLIYDYFTIGADDNLIAFNDYSNTSAPAIYRVMSRFPTKRQISEMDVKLPEIEGVADFQTLLGKEYYIIQGQMYPQTIEGYHTGRQNLRKLASLTIAQADPASDNGYVPLKWSENDGRQLFLKVLYVDMKETVDQGVVQPFTLYCKVKNPSIFSQTLITATTGAATAGAPTSGGASGLPANFPVAFGASTSEVRSTITNPGDLGSYPTITVTGPVTNPRVTNVTSGQFMEVDVTLASSSDVLVITYNETTTGITLNGSSVYNKKTNDSTFFKIKPGVNDFKLGGTSMGAGASAKISFLPAWPLS